jgi:hypothetical protein
VPRLFLLLLLLPFLTSAFPACCDARPLPHSCYVRAPHARVRHYAEFSGYFEGKKAFLDEAKHSPGPMRFYDSNTGRLLFTAPLGRTMDDFLIESKAHGWPSFRDHETNWQYVRILPDGEAVSVDGTHLGHNLPDRHGNRYCIST